jgi:carbamate kinase
VEADLFIMATDVHAVAIGWGTPGARAIHRASPDAMAQFAFPAGSMGPKVDAACRFVRATRQRAVIGALADLPAIVRGEKGTQVSFDTADVTWHT